MSATEIKTFDPYQHTTTESLLRAFLEQSGLTHLALADKMGWKGSPMVAHVLMGRRSAPWKLVNYIAKCSIGKHAYALVYIGIMAFANMPPKETLTALKIIKKYAEAAL